MEVSSWKFYQEALELGETYLIHYRNGYIKQYPKQRTFTPHKNGIQEYIGLLIDITEDKLLFSYNREFHHCCIVSIQHVKYTPKIVK